jgi:translation elongation factor EF-Tu-like GTPase
MHMETHAMTDMTCHLLVGHFTVEIFIDHEHILLVVVVAVVLLVVEAFVEELDHIDQVQLLELMAVLRLMMEELQYPFVSLSQSS